MSAVSCNGTTAYIGLPEREASKLQDLWQRDEVGVELSVEVKAPVVVGVYPMRIARFVLEQANASGSVPTNGQGNGFHPPASASSSTEPMRQPDMPATEDAAAE